MHDLRGSTLKGLTAIALDCADLVYFDGSNSCHSMSAVLSQSFLIDTRSE